MENQEDKESNNSASNERIHKKRKAPSETMDKGKEQEEPTEQMEMDLETNREDLSQEEEVLRKLLNEWRNLDERLIIEDQKRFYADTFQQYKAKLEKDKAMPEEYQESQKESKIDQTGQGKGGKKEEGKILRIPSN